MGNRIINNKSSGQILLIDSTRAPDEVILRFAGSYGVRSTLLSFFTPREQAQAQILSKAFYDKLISAIQTKISILSNMFIFLKCGGKKIGIYNTFTRKISKIKVKPMDIDSRCVQVGIGIYVYEPV